MTPSERNRWWSMLVPFGAVLSSLVLFALIYLGYDLVKGKVSPCESIFQATSVGLSTRIKFLKAEGELQIGREAVAELDDRAQMAALDLKTCCTVLDAGRIDPEQFLQCKAKSRAYDERVGEIVALVKTTAKDGGANASDTEPTKVDRLPPNSDTKLGEAVEAARAVSRDFNRQVVEVRKEQALQQLQALPASHTEVTTEEREPNDDVLNSNILDLNKWVRGSIGSPKDNDFYSFTTPDTYRDVIRVEIQNQSTTLEPNLELYDSQKASLGTVHNATAGGDLTYVIVAPPNSRFTVRASNYYGQSVGVYLIRVVASKSYDAYEPNDDVLNAKQISEGAPVKAQIMDANDVDFFSLGAAGDRERQMLVTIANNSTTLHPNVVVFDSNKTEFGNQHNATSGGDVTYAFKAPPGPVYIRISDYYTQSPGDYTLTVTKQ